MAENFTFWLRLCSTCKTEPSHSDLRTWSLCHYFAPKRSLLPYENLLCPDSVGDVISSDSKLEIPMGPVSPLIVDPPVKKCDVISKSDGVINEGSQPKAQEVSAPGAVKQTVLHKGENYIIVNSCVALTPKVRFESLLREMKKEKTKNVAAPQPVIGGNQNRTNGVQGPNSNGVPLPGVVYGAKESVFIKLNNRIKSLELNISLSSKYLGELSRNYKKQMEDIQRQYNKTMRMLNETRRKTEEGDAAQAMETTLLREDVERLHAALKEMKIERAYFYEEVSRGL